MRLRLADARWISFTARRFGSVDYKGRSAATSLLSVLGIAFGVMTLIVILSVMNGFQMGYIESILEFSSAHVQVEGADPGPIEIIGLPGVRTAYQYSETQALIRGRYSRESGVLLRGIPEDLPSIDAGFKNKVEMQTGSFSLESPSSILLGYELARLISVRTGDRVSLVAVAGGADTDLFPENAEFIVRGLFKTGYYEIDSSFALVSQEAGLLLGGGSNIKTAVKLNSLERDSAFIRELSSMYPGAKIRSWRDYNRAFFNALRIEKNMLLFLTVLIFLVVTVNIYNAMRRSVYERREEISVLTAMGAAPKHVQYVFVFNGLGIGLAGSVIGLLSGLLVSVRINDFFSFAETAVNGIQTFVSALLLSAPGSSFTLFSPDYFYMDEIPVRILFPEVVFVFLFGVFSASCAAWLASRAITRLKPAEVLRYE
ncbi:MAG TPA: ABC transporter permease [Treponemataceae bacterium]|nr:ABC transporter permease [Treponemataceae bacterium]